ncbi:MAG: glycosyltransferase, partial [Actinobacteria bacterium]|nr:glycosyltransferase [Actinomycetota bacterium]
MNRIAFLTDRMIIGHGVDLVVDRLAEGLSKKGYTCRVYCNHHDNTFTNRKSYKIISLPPTKATNPFVYEKKIRRFVNYFNNQDIDLFIIQSYPFYCLAPRLKKPVIIVDHGIISTKGLPLKRRLFYTYLNISQNLSYFTKSDKIVCVSRFLINSLPAYLRKKATYIYNGCDHYHYIQAQKLASPEKMKDIGLDTSKKDITYNRSNNQPNIKTNSIVTDRCIDNAINEEGKAYTGDFSRLKQTLGIEENDIVLLYVGRLNPTNQPYKGLNELIWIYHKIHEKYPNTKLLTVGYGSKNDEEYLKNQGVLSISNAPESLMPLLYNLSDIYVTCSHWEGFDLPALEAQSFGKPVLCYRIGAHPEVVSDRKTGFTVKDKYEFLEKLKLLITNHSLREEMGKNAKEFSKNFSWEKAIDSYDREIKNLLEKTSTAKTKESVIETPGKGGEGVATGVVTEAEEDKSKVKKKEAEVTVVIVNFNSSYPCLKECIDSLKRQTYNNINIIIFDNGSTNENKNALERVAREYNSENNGNRNSNRNIQIVYSNENLGLGAAINKALQYVETDYVLISNFDVVYDTHAIEEFLSQIQSLDDNYLGLAPKIKFFYDRDFIESVGLSLDDSFYIVYQGIGQLDLDQYDRPEDILSVSFTSAFLKTSAFEFEKVGEIDPTFFLFYEDIDFCLRANLFGFKFKSCPASVCYHRFGYHFRDDATSFQRKYYYLKLNLLRTVYKNAEPHNLKRILDIELKIQKENLKDRNLKPIAKKILKEFNKSLGYLKEQTKEIQPLRKLSDQNVLTYAWGEANFFDFV